MQEITIKKDIEKMLSTNKWYSEFFFFTERSRIIDYLSSDDSYSMCFCNEIDKSGSESEFKSISCNFFYYPISSNVISALLFQFFFSLLRICLETVPCNYGTCLANTF